MIRKLPGLLSCLLLALPAWMLGQAFPLIGGPVFAIFIGMGASPFLTKQDQLKEGIAFSSKIILQLAVVLLGFGLNLQHILTVGISSLPIILTTILTALGVAYLFFKTNKINSHLATLIGVGSSICGGSAIAATAPVIEADEEEVAQAISVIFLFNILAALLFPSLGQALNLSHEGFAIFAGTAVNDTSSVTATASAWDSLHHSHTLEAATIVKLTRTLAIIPITFGLALLKQRKNQGYQGKFQLKKAFPNFLLYFILASLTTSLLSTLGFELTLFDSLKTLSKFFIVVAMVAIGVKTNFPKLLKTGSTAIILGAFCWLAIICMDLLIQWLLGIW